jgi:hypothetical protein
MVLRLKLRNRRGDFEAQITKPELPVLRPKLENPPPPWFWGSTKKPTTGFEANPGKTVTTSFEAKLAKTVIAGFEAKPLKTVATGFEAKPAKTVATGFEAKPLTNRQPWFWGSTKKPALVVSTYQVQTAHGAAQAKPSFMFHN